MSAVKSAPRRDRILSAAEVEFGAHGFAGARVDRIATAAGVNKQLLFHYFDSKAGLYRAVSEAVGRRLDLEAAGRGTPGERLRHLVEQLVAAGPELGAVLGPDARSKAAAAAIRIIEDGQRSGHFRDDVNPAPVAEVVVAASLGSRGRGAAARVPDTDTAEFSGTVARMVVEFCAWR